MVSTLNFQVGCHGLESRSGRDNFQTISTPNSYATCPGLSIKWTGRCLVTDRGTKCAWVIHESKAVQIHVQKNLCCLCVPWVPGSDRNPHNNLDQLALQKQNDLDLHSLQRQGISGISRTGLTYSMVS